MKIENMERNYCGKKTLLDMSRSTYITMQRKNISRKISTSCVKKWNSKSGRSKSDSRKKDVNR
jgi:hypothetical protein